MKKTDSDKELNKCEETQKAVDAKTPKVIEIEDLDKEEEEDIQSPESRNSKPERMRVDAITADDSKEADTKGDDDDEEKQSIGAFGVIIRLLMVLVPIAAGIFMYKYYNYYKDVVIPQNKYNEAVSLYDNGDYEEAISRFRTMGDYEQSETYILASFYAIAENYYAEGDLEHAVTYYEIADGYSDADIKILDCYYTKGMEAFDGGFYQSAADLFANAGSYKNSMAMINKCKLKRLEFIDDMDTVQFGSYYQSNAEEKEPIEWIVIKKGAEKVLLMSKYILDCCKYDADASGDCWDASDLREWINSTFYDAAFSEEDKLHISAEFQYTPINEKYGTQGGEPTTDNVFVLSCDEASTLFLADEARICSATPYSVSQGVFVNEYNSGFWWLREQGIESDKSAVVHLLGMVDYYGIDSSIDCVGVRPAIWVKTDF